MKNVFVVIVFILIVSMTMLIGYLMGKEDGKTECKKAIEDSAMTQY